MKQHLVIKKSKVFKNNVIMIAIVLASIASVAYWLSRDSIPKQYLKPIKVNSIIKNGILKGIGTIQPTQRELMSAPSDGTIKALKIREGQTISRGDILAELSNYELEQKIHTAQFELLNTVSQVAIDKSNLAIRLSKVKSELGNASMQLKQQQLELNANKILAEDGIISSIRFKQSRMQFEQSKLALEAKKTELVLFKEAYEQQLIAYKNKVQLAENQIEYLVAKQSQLTLTAKFDGVVSQNTSKLGQIVKQGQPLFELIETNDLLAKVQVPQYSSEQLEKGQKAKIITPSGNIEAEVDYIDTVIRSGSINVFLTINSGTPNWLRSDQAIEAHIYTSEQQATYSVEKPADFEKFEHWSIFEVNADDQAVLTRISFHETQEQQLSFKEKLGSNYVLLIPSEYTKKDKINFELGYFND
ncbi:HlyD family secretion protein [Pseudoalteromonas sp. S1610]|uniref:HlyD family secretion protein n=2 Tax=unclassified Pseudoalteromonas TaxID=194690 RepID=UPI00110C1E5A|nr:MULTISPECIES: HlyD family efflux transporter periplasmic adaptor subunit [unclassified Pseudoalteromonas]MCK8128269.1 HlyD family efflux transporter periplasmic adaptor subunit [Pseudoalteromonas sp. 2CM39R]TMP59151.1 HlyD family secretion protein [Pseudoalteromonas sp. S1610]